MKPDFYSYEMTNAQGVLQSMLAYKNKVVLIVNVASKCGFTNQYEALEKLHQQFKDRGLVILAFPCNQFGGQEPGDNEEIQSFCKINYGVSFPVMAKIEVNGPNTSPLFQFLKGAAPGVLGSEAIKWNFTKFLIDRHGRVVERYAPQTPPESLAAQIEGLLSN